MEEVQVGVIYNTLLDSNEGDLIPHASQTIYYSNINENKIIDWFDKLFKWSWNMQAVRGIMDSSWLVSGVAQLRVHPEFRNFVA